MLVSIIVPIYNGEVYLKDCLESILNQTYKETEIILVDDGSTDASRKICDLYAQKYKNVISLYQENSGVSKARNLGLNCAKGEYIYFCDSDDILHQDILETFVRDIEDKKVDVSCCAYQCFTKDIVWQESKENPAEVITGMDMFYNVLKNPLCSGYVWNKLFKKNIIEQREPLRFSEKITIVEDEQFVLEYICRSKNMSLSGKNMYAYRNNENGAIRKNFTEKKLTCIWGREDVWKICNEEKCDDKILGIAWNKLMQVYVYAYRNILYHNIPDKQYWKDVVKKKFFLYVKLPYKIDETWNWKPKMIYYFMKYCLKDKN